MDNVRGEPVARFAVEAGPDAARVLELPAGCHLLGRAAGPARLRDPSVEAHHALVDVGPEVTVSQLAGRTPIRVDGRPIRQRREVVPGDRLDIGASRVRVLGPGEVSPPHLSGGRVVIGVADGALVGGIAGEHGWRADPDRPAPGDPVVVDLSTCGVVAVVGDHARSVVDAILDQLDRPVAVTGGGDQWSLTRAVDPDRRAGAPVQLVVADGLDDIPDGVATVLSVGSTWHGWWWRDRHTGRDGAVRLHVAGRYSVPRAGGADGPLRVRSIARPGAV